MHGSDAQPAAHTGAALELPANYVMWFVDFASAFDSVDRDSLWQIMVAEPPKADQGVLLFDQDEG